MTTRTKQWLGHGMKSAEPSRVDLPRPVGVRVLAAALAVHGMQSFGAFVQLFPLWLDAARHHRYGNASFAWVLLGSAIAALAAAYGLWRRRRWARIPAVVVVVLAMASLCLIAGFGVADLDPGAAWLVAGVLVMVAFVLAAGVLRYVWRQT